MGEQVAARLKKENREKKDGRRETQAGRRMLYPRLDGRRFPVMQWLAKQPKMGGMPARRIHL